MAFHDVMHPCVPFCNGFPHNVNAPQCVLAKLTSNPLLMWDTSSDMQMHRPSIDIVPKPAYHQQQHSVPDPSVWELQLPSRTLCVSFTFHDMP